jgi:ABC-type polysaccharide/polyol phosphate export permease
LFGAPVWFHLAWQEIKQRYRRSLLGPFWIAINTGVFVAAMGPLYGKLLNQPIGSYFQHLSVSFVVWTFVSSYINEATSAYITAEGFIKQVKLPYSVFILKTLTRNFLIFLHNLSITVVVLFFFPPQSFSLVPLALLGLLLVAVNLLWIGTLVAMLCARFRDIPQIVSSAIQVLFFLTPIMWKAEMLGEHTGVADWNLIYHLIEVVRTPLLGEPVKLLSWYVSIGSAVLGSALVFGFFCRYRARISYWV